MNMEPIELEKLQKKINILRDEILRTKTNLRWVIENNKGNHLIEFVCSSIELSFEEVLKKVDEL